MATTTEPRPVTASDLMSFEDGEMEPNEVLDLFSRLIATGMVWHLQGAYGRAAAQLVDEGYLSEDGEVLREVED